MFSDLHAHRYKEFDKASDLTGSTRLDSILDVFGPDQRLLLRYEY